MPGKSIRLRRLAEYGKIGAMVRKSQSKANLMRNNQVVATSPNNINATSSALVCDVITTSPSGTSMMSTDEITKTFVIPTQTSGTTPHSTSTSEASTMTLLSSSMLSSLSSSLVNRYLDVKNFDGIKIIILPAQSRNKHIWLNRNVCNASAIPVLSRVNSESSQIIKLQLQNKKLTQKLTNIKSQKTMIKSQKTTIKSQRSFILNMQKQLDSKSLEIFHLRSENDKLKHAISALKIQCKNLQNDHNSWRRKVIHGNLPKKNSIVVPKKDSPTDFTQINIKRPTSSRFATYIHLPRVTVAVGLLSKKRLKARIDILDKVMRHLTGSDSDYDLGDLLAMYLKEKCFTPHPIRDSFFPKKLSAYVTNNILVSLKLTWSQFRKLKKQLTSHNCDVFPSERELRSELNSRQIYNDQLLFDKVYFDNNSNSPKSCLRVASLIKIVSESWAVELKHRKPQDTLEFQGKIFIGFGGDGGGKNPSTKFVFTFYNFGKANSVSNVHFICMYYGKDSGDNLRKVLYVYREEFENLKTLKLPFPVSDKVIEMRPLSLFLFGDMSFLSSFMGHKGCAAKYPCLLCTVPLIDLRNPKMKLNQCEDYHTRTLNECLSGNKMTNKLSFINEPIFPFSFEFICPPVLHIPLGLVSSIYEAIQEACYEIDAEDYTSIEEENIMNQMQIAYETYSELKNKSYLKHLEIKLTKNMILCAKQLCCDADIPKAEGFGNENTCISDVNNTDNNICCTSPVCCFTGLTEEYVISLPLELNWKQCDKCQNWWHDLCSLVTRNCDYDNSAIKWCCIQCQGLQNISHNVIELVQIQMNNLNEEIVDIQAQKGNSLQQFELYNTKLKAYKCSAVNNLQFALEKLKVDVLAYNTHKFVGNHCKNLLRKNDSVDAPMILTECLSNRPELRQKYYDYLSLLAEIFPLLSAARFLTEEEIQKLVLLCKKLDDTFSKAFPNQSKTPKFHMLVKHVPEFVIRHKTIGLFSEQALESLHCLTNSLDRVYACIRDDHKRMRLVMEKCHILTTVKNLNAQNNKVNSKSLHQINCDIIPSVFERRSSAKASSLQSDKQYLLSDSSDSDRNSECTCKMDEDLSLMELFANNEFANNK